MNVHTHPQLGSPRSGIPLVHDPALLTPPAAVRRGKASVEAVLRLAARKLDDRFGCLADTPGATQLGVVLQAVERVVRGDHVDLEHMEPSPGVSDMLEKVRRVVLEDSLDAVPDAAVLQVLRAIERIRDSLDEDAGVRAARRLSGGDALQLLVEVAHDMRSPLNAVLFLTEHMRTSRNLTPLQERQVGLVYSAALGLSALANDLVELARGGGGLMDRSTTAFSVAGVIESVRGIVEPMLEQKRLTLAVGALQLDTRMGHPVALGRVLLNLVTNAIKFTPSGQVSIECEPTSRRHVRFTVADTGRGIPPDVLPALLEPYRPKAGETGVAFSSAGLGLSICRSLVARMGGQLTVESVIGSGTRFSFELDLPVSSRMADIGW